MRSFLKKLMGFKNKLTRLNDNEPVSKLALAVIILLDVFILSIIFSGLEDHTRQLTSPDEYFPYDCRQVFISNDWTKSNKMEKLQQLVLTDYNRYSYQHDSPFKASRIRNMHPQCGEFYEQVRLIAENDVLKGLFIDRQQVSKLKDQFLKQYDSENEVYDTKLLENIAERSNSELSSMATSLKSKSAEIDRLNAQIVEIDKSINSDPLVKSFWALTRPGDGTRREGLIADLNRFEKVYLFKELLWQMLFLLPLLTIFCLWHVKSVAKTRTIQSLITAHLIVVVSIPIVLKVADVAIELIPRHFFKKLFELLERLYIIALWHYIVIIASIGVAVLFVYIIQKKIFNKARLREKRLSSGACHFCGKILPEKKSMACPFCGEKQLRKCSRCGIETHITGLFCSHCGQEQAAQQNFGDGPGKSRHV